MTIVDKKSTFPLFPKIVNSGREILTNNERGYIIIIMYALHIEYVWKKRKEL